MKRKKGFTLLELLIVLFIMGMLITGAIKIFVGIGEWLGSDSSTSTTSAPATTAPATTAHSDDSIVIEEIHESANEDTLRSATTITIKEKMLSWGKHYDILVEDKVVATVTGKSVRIISGDVFTMKTKDGKVLASEKECKRFFKLDRSAICYDAKGNVTGYLGQESIKDFFSLSYVFHFYDADKNEIGKSKKLGKSSLNKHKLYDSSGNEDFDIDKKFQLGGDKYILTRKDFESSIPLEYAIFIVCIEDAIGDAN